MTDISRRRFIKIGTAGVGTAALASGLTTRWWDLDDSPLYNPDTIDGEHIANG